MELGERIRDLRLGVGLTQEELADRCELTKGYISQLENDLTSPSIATLVDILSALGTSLKEFFGTMDETEQVIFTKDDFIEKVGDGWSLKWLVPNAQKNAMEPVLVEIEPNSQTEEDFPHEGEEFGLVLNGEVEIILGKKRYKCKKGQSFYITPSKTHYIKNKKNTKAVLVWVSSPPNF
jgi:transcriptional regulator with XRE-family HTH domain